MAKPIAKCEFRVVGQTALLEARLDLDVVATANVDAVNNATYAVLAKFNELLHIEALEYDPLSNEIWMLIQRAKEKERADNALKNEPFYVKTMAWFHYLGLLRHNKIEPRRHVVTLGEALRAGALEPRILELLPAVLVVLPKALKFSEKDIPDDLNVVVRGIRARKADTDFRGVPPAKYLHWLRAPTMNVAKRRLNFRRTPRRRMGKTHSIGEVIRSGRLALSLTQEQLAKKYDLSLRVIRDLEQGKMDASLKTTNEILAAFGRSLGV